MRLLIIICLFFQLPLFAQEGVNFRELGYEEALAQAKTENKLVFIDCYTSWCGPCKEMTNKVFPQKAAGDYFNPRFVCVKYDMEKGEGIALAKKFDVHAYPSFLIVRPDGTIQHKLVGGSDLEKFIQRVEKGMNPETSLVYQHELYKTGKMSKQQLMAYKNALSEADDDEGARKVYGELLAQLTDEEKVQPEFWSIYEDESCVIGSPVSDFMLEHLEDIRKNSGQEKVDSYLINKYWKLLGDYVMGYNKPDDASIETLKQQVPKLGVKKQEELNQLLKLAELVYNQQADEIAALIETKLPELNLNALKTHAFAFRTIQWKLDHATPRHIIDLSEKLTKLVISDMEHKSENLTVKDLDTYELILSAFQWDRDKKTYARLADIGEKVIAGTPDNEIPRYLMYDYKKYRALSYSGIHFQEQTLEQLLEKNKENGQRILVYCYSGNKASRETSRNILTDENLGDYVNTRFACIQVNIGKKEGKELRANYGITHTPTLLLLNRDSSLCLKIDDYSSAENIIETIKKSLDKRKNNIQ